MAFKNNLFINGYRSYPDPQMDVNKNIQNQVLMMMMTMALMMTTIMMMKNYFTSSPEHRDCRRIQPLHIHWAPLAAPSAPGDGSDDGDGDDGGDGDADGDDQDLFSLKKVVAVISTACFCFVEKRLKKETENFQLELQENRKEENLDKEALNGLHHDESQPELQRLNR